MVRIYLESQKAAFKEVASSLFGDCNLFDFTPSCSEPRLDTNIHTLAITLLTT